MAVLRLIALVFSLCLAAVFAANVRCGRFTHKHVWVQPDDRFIFQTQRRDKPLYEDNTRCSVRYTPWGNCSEVGFTCDKMSVRAEGEMFQEMQNIKDSPFYDMSAADMARERFE